MNVEIITNFLTINPRLRTLEVIRCESVTTSILNKIDTRLPNLEHLSFYIDDLFGPFSVNEHLDENWTHVFKIPNLNV